MSKESLKLVIDYDWAEEAEDFCETFGVEILPEDQLEEWISTCEENEEMKNHIFYHLMVVKQAYQV